MRADMSRGSASRLVISRSGRNCFRNGTLMAVLYAFFACSISSIMPIDRQASTCIPNFCRAVSPRFCFFRTFDIIVVEADRSETQQSRTTQPRRRDCADPSRAASAPRSK